MDKAGNGCARFGGEGTGSHCMFALPVKEGVCVTFGPDFSPFRLRFEEVPRARVSLEHTASPSAGFKLCDFELILTFQRPFLTSRQHNFRVEFAGKNDTGALWTGTVTNKATGTKTVVGTLFREWRACRVGLLLWAELVFCCGPRPFPCASVHHFCCSAQPTEVAEEEWQKSATVTERPMLSAGRSG